MTLTLSQTAIYIQRRDYLSLAAITAVVYDYILTFPEELEYIWEQPWSWVSIMFVLVRYFGLCFAVLFSIWGSSFLPGPAEIFLYVFGKIILLLGQWNFWIFMCAADLVMILRVRALYKGSKIIFGILFTFYASQMISFFVYYVIFSAKLGPSNAMYTVHVRQYTFCTLTGFSAGPYWLEALPAALQIALGTLMCLLTIIQVVKELPRKDETATSFGLNRYSKRLVREGMVYFIVILVFALLHLLLSTKIGTADGWYFLLTAALQQIPPVTLVPRFMLNLRALYARDVRTSGLDTAFGLVSDTGGVHSTIVFAHSGSEDEMAFEEAVWEVRRAIDRVCVSRPVSRVSSLQFPASLGIKSSVSRL